jgi:hypothetical protein
MLLPNHAVVPCIAGNVTKRVQLCSMCTATWSVLLKCAVQWRDSFQQLSHGIVCVCVNGWLVPDLPRVRCAASLGDWCLMCQQCDVLHHSPTSHLAHQYTHSPTSHLAHQYTQSHLTSGTPTLCSTKQGTMRSPTSPINSSHSLAT